MIQVELSAAEVPIEPGGTAQLAVTITNKQEHDDHVFIEIEGIDVEWYALPVPALNVAAGESQVARVLFKIARSSQSQAGTYPFVVRAGGMETGESGLQQATLTIKPFSALQVELTPKRASSSFMRKTVPFDLRVSNLGNREETLDLYASDPEDGCAYEFETDRITLGPGKTQAVPLVIEPVTQPILGSSRLFGFVTTARSVSDSYVSASANGQLERKALLSPLVFLTLLLLLLVGGGYALFRPRPVVLHSFTAAPLEVREGDEVTLAWDADNVQEGFIQPDNIPIHSSVGSIKVHPKTPTEYKLVARGGGKEVIKSVGVVVLKKPPPLKPLIQEFTADRTIIHQGDSVTLTWKVDRADTIHLNPTGPSHPAQMWSSQVVTPVPPATTYTLRVQGPGGFAESRPIKITVAAPTVSIAHIKYFKAKPSTIVVGDKATLSWEVENGATVEIDNGVGGDKPKAGKAVVSPTETTTYTLRVLDDKGNLQSAKATIVVNPNPEPIPANPNTTEPGRVPPP